MRKLFSSVGILSAFAGAGVVASVSMAQAAVPGQQYFSLGMGGGVLTNMQPCADVPCNNGDTCSCVTSSGTVGYSTSTKTFPNGTYSLALSVDLNSAFHNGAGGQCYGSAGLLTLTTKIGTLNLEMAGTACHLAASGGGPEAAPFGISIPATIVSGTGAYNNPVGTGTIAATFDPVGKTVILDLVGYGILNGSGSAN